MDVPSPLPNGRIDEHGQRLSRLEDNVSSLSTTLGQANIKLDVLKESLDALASAIRDLSESVTHQNIRLQPLEKAESARERRRGMIRKGFAAIVIAAAGAASTRLLAIFFS